jgi:ABC-2 type transport system ATP-binding protein
MYAIEMISLSKTYLKRKGPPAQAVVDLSLAIPPGQVIGFLGPNGVGKTTLVRQITTALLPTSGDVRVPGYSAVSKPSRVKSLMGTIPQEAALY